MGHKKSIGLPGGPNEFLQDITQYISVEGYKSDSPDKNNPVNIIESSNITMEGVDFPVRGYGNNGVVQDMTPGTLHYDYGNADYVVEVPMAQDGREQATISQYVEPAWYEKAVDYLASPMTALSYIVQGKDLPDRLPINMEERNAYDMVIDMVNPAAMAKYAAQAKRDYDNEEYLSAGFNSLGALPIVPAILSKGKKVLPKAVVNNITRYADDVVKSAKPNAKNFSAVTEVNPLTQNQAKNLANQGRNTEIFNAFEEGANTIDDFVKSYTGDLSSPEGFKRLIAQEADYLRSIGFDEARIAAQSEINAGARLNEIINIGNTNRAISVGEKSVDAVIGNNYNFNNASYTPNTRNVEYLDDLFYQPGMDIGAFNLNKTKVGAKVLPGNTNLGTMFSNNRAVAAHEIGGHGLQSGRRLPLDQRLKKLDVDASNLNPANEDAYGYFMSGSKGKEPSAYLHELRQAMLDNKFIRNRYDYVSPEMLKRAQTIFDLRPSGTVNTMGDAFHSNTRILDFMKPVESNFDLLARELNKLPAMVPIGIGLSGAAALSQERYGGSIPKAQDGDETSSDLEKEIDGLDLSKYNVRVIQYPYGSKKFSPGHIESVLVDKKTGRQVNKISGTKLVGYINRWAGPGNRRVTQRDYEQEEDVRTVDLNLSESEIKNFITEAQLFTGTNKGKEHTKSGLSARKLPLSINDDNIYDYDFVDSNCATGVCMGLGMDPNSPENTQAGITDPNLVMDGILSKYNDFIVPGSSTGYRTSREEGLRNLVKDNLGENVNAGTIDVLTNYLDGLNRDDINNTLESILQNPTALKILKDDGDLSKIGDRAFRDLTSLFNANFNPFVDVGRGREKMAKSRLKNIQRDVSNMYESIPEGTIPATLEALNEQYIKPNNPFDVSLEGVKNIPDWWKNKLGFKEGGSTTNPYTIYMNYINGIDESEVAQNIFDKLNRMYYRDAKTRGMGVANYIATNIIPNS